MVREGKNIKVGGIGDLYRLKKYIRAKFFDIPDGKKVVRQDLLYLCIKGLLATVTRQKCS